MPRALGSRLILWVNSSGSRMSASACCAGCARGGKIPSPPQTTVRSSEVREQHMSKRKFWRFAAAAIIAAATLAGGIWGGRAFSQSDTGAQRVESAYTEALSVISDNYVEEIDYGKANEAAIQGMLWTLDPHSNYFNPSEYRRLMQDQESRFSGIGVSILRHRDGVYVQTPIKGTPADRAGLRFGDRIVEVDGKDARDWTTQGGSPGPGGAGGGAGGVK